MDFHPCAGASRDRSPHQFGQLPDGRCFGLSTPAPGRTPLVIAISDDGVTFDRHHIVGDDENRPPRFDGLHKGGRYGYPWLEIVGDTGFVIYSIAKEDVAIARFDMTRVK